MLKPLALQFTATTEQVRMVVSNLTGKLLTDEQIEERFFNREPLLFDPNDMGEEGAQAAMAFIGLLIADYEEEK